MPDGTDNGGTTDLPRQAADGVLDLLSDEATPEQPADRHAADPESLVNEPRAKRQGFALLAASAALMIGLVVTVWLLL